MPPAPDLAHQDVAGEIYRQAATILTGKPCRAFIAPVDVRLPKHNEADENIDTVVQPDVLVVCDSGKPEMRQHIEAWGMSGINSVPDLQG